MIRNTYTVTSARLRHNGEALKPGNSIELTDEEALPLLKLGVIAISVTMKGDEPSYDELLAFWKASRNNTSLEFDKTQVEQALAALRQMEANSAGVLPESESMVISLEASTEPDQDTEPPAADPEPEPESEASSEPEPVPAPEPAKPAAKAKAASKAKGK